VLCGVPVYFLWGYVARDANHGKRIKHRN
jgi:hypothetical protein